MRFLFVVVSLVLSATYLHAQEQEYPNWIAERYCAERGNFDACRATLIADDLYGITKGTAQSADSDGDGEADQWGQEVSLPRLAQCSYQNPKNAKWDFDEECYFTKVIRVSAFFTETIRVGVENGSSFFLETVKEHGSPDRHMANGEPARLVSATERRCYQVITTGELLCVTPTYPPQISEREGWCSWERTVAENTSSRCTERKVCVIGIDSGEAGCTTDFNWADGTKTEVGTEEEWVGPIDGHPVSQDDPRLNWWDTNRPRCVVREDNGDVFCFSTQALEVPKPDEDNNTDLAKALIEEIRPLDILSEAALEQVIGVLVDTLSHHTVKGKIAAVQYMFSNPKVTAQFVSAAIVDDLGRWQTSTGLVTSALVMTTVNAMANFAYEKTLAEGNTVGATIARQTIRYAGSIVNASFTAGSAGGNPQMFVATLIADQASFIAQDVQEIREVGDAIDKLFEQQALSTGLFELRIATLIRLGQAPAFAQTNPKTFDDFAKQSFTAAYGKTGAQLYKVASAAETARRWATLGEADKARELLGTIQGFVELLDEGIRPAAADVLILALRSIRQNEQ